MWWHLLLAFLLTIHKVASQSADFAKFIDAAATSTNVGTSPSEFDPKRALQPGTGYWCSSGNHEDDEVVAWTGKLSKKTPLKGLKIRWAYSPHQIQIAGSSDGVNDAVIIDWKETPSKDVSFDEEITFPHIQHLISVKISMRGALHNFIGINEIQPISEGDGALLMLFGGITSTAGDLCLQVDSGDVNRDGAEVILDYCTHAIAAGDGRELWRRTTQKQFISALSNPPHCLTLRDSNTTSGGKIVLQNCKTALQDGDGRSNWELDRKTQFRLLKPGSWCMSQTGTGAGLTDLAKNAKATSSSIGDKNHGPENALDGNTQTYWASGGFDDTGDHLANLDINLGQPTKISRVRIDWEYPAMRYGISLSADGVDFLEVSSTVANPANITTDDVGGGKTAQYVRIWMQRPHPRYGKFNARFVYGIRKVAVYSNKLQAIIKDCREATNTSPDCRDKYWAEPVTEFDPTLARKLFGMTDDLQKRVSALETLDGDLEDVFPRMTNCLTEKKMFNQRLASSLNQSAEIEVELGKMRGVTSERMKLHLQLGLKEGDSRELPAEDCFTILQKNKDAVSGFYYILPKCAPEPIRVWCDMEVGSPYYFWNGNPPRKPNTSIMRDVTSVEDIRLHCAEMGLEPLIVRAASQIKNLHVALKKMGYDLKAAMAIPLAYDSSCSAAACKGTFKDLLFGSDITALMIATASAANAHEALMGHNAAGLGFSETSTFFFDLGSTDISAIVCSTNTIASQQQLTHVDVTCDTVVKDNPMFQGSVNTNFVVRCPPGCEEDDMLPVFGSEGLYSDTSSICRSAIHAGVIKQGGEVNVAVESRQEEFTGSYANGVTSKSFPGESVERTVRIGSYYVSCPIDIVERAPTSFLQMSSRVATRSTHGDAPIQQGGPKEQIEMTNPETNKVLEATYQAIDEVHGVDPSFITTALEDAARTVGEARTNLKPAEKLARTQATQALETFDYTEDVADTLYEITGEHFTTLHDLSEELEMAVDGRTRMHGFQSWTLDFSRMPFEDTWITHDSLRVENGPSVWSYESNRADAVHVLAQGSFIGGKDFDPSQGTYVKLKNHRFFNFDLWADFYVEGTGTTGIAFRVRDFDHMYLFDLCHSKNAAAGCDRKRLLKVDNGRVDVVLETADGGYISGEWFTVHVEASHGRIRICVGKSKDDMERIFDVQDESFLSGTVALYTSNLREGAAYFKNIKVKSKACRKIVRDGAPPPPPTCSIFKEDYASGFHSTYHVIDAADAKGGPSRWGYHNNIGGRKKVIAQLTAIRGDGNLGTRVIIKGYRFCDNGSYSTEFFPQCPDGIIGMVYRYFDPANYSILEISRSGSRVREFRHGIPYIIATSANGFNTNQWNYIQIRLSDKIVQMNGPPEANNSDHVILKYRNPHNIDRSGRVGLTSFNCEGVAFNEIRMTPFTPPHHVIGGLESKSAFLGDTCASPQHYLQRRDACNTMFLDAPVKAASCLSTFCDTCCDFHTSLLPTERHQECLENCRAGDEVAYSTYRSWLTVSKECCDNTSLLYQGCQNEQNPQLCTKEVCMACCETSQSSENHEWRLLETKQCRRMCTEANMLNDSIRILYE